MSDHAVDTTTPHDLRTRAATRLGRPATGAATVTGPAGALAALHALATSPTTAADALALLHELQVHQVELDMQARELRDSRDELESALRRQIALYDFQPVACFTVDRHLVVHELNEAGARLLGMERGAACGLGLHAFVGARGADTLQTMADLAATGEAVPAVGLTWRTAQEAQHTMQAHLAVDPAGGGCLLVLVDVGAPTGRATAP